MEDHSEETRDIYHKQHMRVAADQKAMNRFINMFSTDYFGLGDDYFKNKLILDAGCGDTAKLIIAFHGFGARKLHGLELGEDFIPTAKKSLESHNVPSEDVTFTSASVLDIPYNDNHFDFVACHGVLVHLNDIQEVEKAFSELSRVTKPGGYLYTVFGHVGGLFEGAIVPAVREYYRTNSEFKDLIDNIQEKDFDDVTEFISKKMKEHTNEDIDLSFLKEMFDTDLCVTIQNIIQAPVRLKIDENYIKKQYLQNEFTNIKRLRRYVKRENIRKFFAPLHYERDYPLSKILYGSGNLEFLAQKK